MTTNASDYNDLDARVSKTDSGGTFNYKRNGAGVTDAVLSDGAATYTPGISERRAGSSKFLHSGMKNADAQSGASANVDSSRTYDAFGNLTGSSGTWSGPFGYAGGFGYQEDPDHGLRLLGHRYYDSSTGRFISKDPIGDGRNWTAYCGNNPLARMDDGGLWFKDLWSVEVWSEGLKTSGHALLSSLSFGRYDGGAYKDEPGFGESAVAWQVAGAALGGAGAGKVAAKNIAGYMGKKKLKDKGIKHCGLKHAGKRDPRTGVKFTRFGFPKFKVHKRVKIKPQGTRAKDAAEANRRAGYKQTPKGKTWHHSEERGVMELVDSVEHGTSHTGGYQIWYN